MTPSSAIRRQIFEELYKRCDRYFLAAPWSSLRVDADVRACPSDMVAIVAELSAAYKPKQLIGAGIAERKDGALVPTAPLLRPGSPLIFLRTEPKTPPAEVLTETGTLFGHHLPLVASLGERRTLQALDTWPIGLLLASSIEDLVILRALGLPASLALGLDTVDEGQLPSLMDALGWTRRAAIGLPEFCPGEPSDLAPDDEPYATEKADVEPPHPGKPTPPKPTKIEPAEPAAKKPAIIFIGWSIATLNAQEPIGLAAIRNHLRLLVREIKIQGIDAGHWEPTKGFLERLKRRIPLGLLDSLAQQMAVAIDETSFEALEFRSPPPPPAPPAPPKNYCEALQELRKALRTFAQGKAKREDVNRADDVCQEWLESELLAPLLANSSEPASRNLQVAMATVSRPLHRLGIVVDAQLAQIPLTNPLGAAEAISAIAFKDLIALTNTMIQLNKELRA